MFIIQGQSGSLSAIVATSNAHKAIFHFRRMSQSGLHPVIKTSEGETCTARTLMAVCRAQGVK